MYQKTSVAALLVGLLVASSFVGAAAFTNASVDRSASIDVVNDKDGIIGLEAGGSSMVTENSTGAIEIDAAVGSASGINTAATVSVGDGSDPTNTYAFSVTNNAGSAKTIDLSYTVTGTDSNGGDDLTFTVYDDTGSSVGSFAEGGSTSINSAASGATYYVVITVDTTGNPSSDDLSGTLSITAS